MVIIADDQINECNFRYYSCLQSSYPVVFVCVYMLFKSINFNDTWQNRSQQLTTRNRMDKIFHPWKKCRRRRRRRKETCIYQDNDDDEVDFGFQENGSKIYSFLFGCVFWLCFGWCILHNNSSIYLKRFCTKSIVPTDWTTVFLLSK